MFDKVKELFKGRADHQKKSEKSKNEIQQIDLELDEGNKILEFKENEKIEEKEKLEETEYTIKLLDEKKENSSDKIKKEIEEILNENDINKLKYLLIQLSKIYVWQIPEIETRDNYLEVKFKNRTLSVDQNQLILSLLFKYKDKIIINDSREISIFEGKVNISFYITEYFITIRFYIKKWLKKEELSFIKNIIENEVLNKLVNTDRVILNEEDIIEFVEKHRDILSFEIVDRDYIIRINGNLDLSTFEKIVQKIINRSSNIFTKITEVVDPVYFLEILLTRWYSEKDIRNRISFSLRENKINFKFDKLSKDVWLYFLKPLIEEILEQKEGKVDVNKLISDLVNVWLKVKLPEWENKNLEDLYNKHWFVGYKDLKEEINLNVIKPWKEKDKYLEFTKDNFPHIWSEILPNAILFWWPPGTGKTTISRIIWEYLQYPFVYLPVQSIMSKWYWESERILNWIFKRVEKIWQHYWWVILMIDEIDEIGRNRDDSHEATARLTGILLRKLDGLEKVENVLLIWATNRKDWLDPALLSRFWEQFYFRYPNSKEIKAIFSHYLPFSDKLEEEFFKKFEWKITWRDIKTIAKKIARKMLKESKETIEVQELKELIVEYIKKN